jgi:tetrahydromethanopterin S-methyltransferase subunit F
LEDLVAGIAGLAAGVLLHTVAVLPLAVHQSCP